MKIVALALALFLGGCATFNPFGSINNPLTPNRLAQVEAAYGIALSAAVGYRRACAQRILARATCGPIVALLQRSDRRAQVAIKAARTFTRRNPTLDATSVVSNAALAVQAFRDLQQQNGVQ